MNDSTITISGVLQCQHIVNKGDINSPYDLWQHVSTIWLSSSGRPLPSKCIYTKIFNNM